MIFPPLLPPPVLSPPDPFPCGQTGCLKNDKSLPTELKAESKLLTTVYEALCDLAPARFFSLTSHHLPPSLAALLLHGPFLNFCWVKIFPASGALYTLFPLLRLLPSASPVHLLLTPACLYCRWQWKC